MAPQALLGAAVVVALTAGCDLSQKKPETASFAPSASLPAPQTTGALPGEAAASEKSIRLFGRGVSRKRQTRV